MKASTSSKNPKLSWGVEQRQILCCLYRFFECNGDQVSALFSAICRDHLVHCGFGNKDVPYATLNAQWSWMKKQKRPVWHHVHIDTEFRTDREWKKIVHKIRSTAFELGILVQEKLFDTISIPNDDFDMNKNIDEYKASVLIASETREQTLSTSAAATAPSSDEFYVVTEESFAQELSPSSPESPFTIATGTPITDATTVHEDDNRKEPHVQDSVTNSPLHRESQIVYDSRSYNEPLVTSNGKVCFWCEREGVCLENQIETSGYVDESAQGYRQEMNELSMPESPKLAAENAAAGDLNKDYSTHLPGVCGVDDMPPLLYRWSNTNSQGMNTESLLVAGWFTETYPNMILPGSLSQEEFLATFSSHVTRVRVPTPFISAFARPLAPIHRALRNRSDAKILVIDPRKLRTPIFNAQPLASITGTTVRRWKGYGEFAIWGYVPSEAIVCTFDITTLEEVASHNLRIRQFLQLSLIEAEGTCHRGLRQDLRVNIENHAQQVHLSVLMRLAQQLDVPEEYRWYFATDIHQAWTMNLGDTSRDSEELDRSTRSPEPPEPGVSEEIYHPLESQASRGTRGISESTWSYVPPKSDDGSCSESSSEEEDEEEDSMSQSPEAPCPRRDTPSPAFSVDSDTDDSVQLYTHRPPKRRCQYSRTANEVEMLEIAVPLTPPRTSRYFPRPADLTSPVPLIAFGPVRRSNALNARVECDDEPEWPSDGETFDAKNTPTRSRYFAPAAGTRGEPQENNLFVLSDDELRGI